MHDYEIPTVQADTPTTKRLREKQRKRRGESFYPPAPRAISCQVNQAGPDALILWLELRRFKQMGRSPPFTLGSGVLEIAGLTRKACSRALDALEAEGFVSVERQRGRLPRIWLDKRKVADAA